MKWQKKYYNNEISVTNLYSCEAKNICAIKYRIQADNKNKGKVFAYFGYPETIDSNKKYPAVILVHGGGGKAFYDWVKFWTKQGYIAIAPDFAGQEIDILGNLSKNKDGGSSDYGSFSSICKDEKESWTYFSVASILCANTILQNDKLVDKSKIGLVGISWGGVLGLIAASVDTRIKASAIIYSAGFIAEDLLGQEAKVDLDVDRMKFYNKNFDPKSYVKKSKNPMLIMAGCDDAAFSMKNRVRTCKLMKKQPYFALRKMLLHDNTSNFENKEVLAFFNYQFNKNSDFIIFSKIKQNKSEFTATFKYNKDIECCNFIYTDAKQANPHQWEWTETTAKIIGDRISFKLDEVNKNSIKTIKLCFFSVTLKSKIKMSTEVFIKNL